MRLSDSSVVSFARAGLAFTLEGVLDLAILNLAGIPRNDRFGP